MIHLMKTSDMQLKPTLMGSLPMSFEGFRIEYLESFLPLISDYRRKYTKHQSFISTHMSITIMVHLQLGIK